MKFFESYKLFKTLHQFKKNRRIWSFTEAHEKPFKKSYPFQTLSEYYYKRFNIFLVGNAKPSNILSRKTVICGSNFRNLVANILVLKYFSYDTVSDVMQTYV